MSSTMSCPCPQTKERVPPASEQWRTMTPAATIVPLASKLPLNNNVLSFLPKQCSLLLTPINKKENDFFSFFKKDEPFFHSLMIPSLKGTADESHEHRDNLKEEEENIAPNFPASKRTKRRTKYVWTNIFEEESTAPSIRDVSPKRSATNHIKRIANLKRQRADPVWSSAIMASDAAERRCEQNQYSHFDPDERMRVM